MPLPVDRPAAEAIVAASGERVSGGGPGLRSAGGLRHVACRSTNCCATADEAAAFAEAIGYPVVLRIVSPQIIHKLGGARRGVERGRCGERAAGLRTHASGTSVPVVPAAEIRGISVHRMIPPGYELILASSATRRSAATLMFGLGGIYVELFGDVTFGLAPIDRSTAARMVRQVRAFRLLQGCRGQPPADIPHIEQCLVRLGQLVTDIDRIVELDINPLIAAPAASGNLVADVRIRLTGPVAKPS